MRLLGHPVHPMLVHFPVALWPAHWALHVFARALPPTVSAVGGFWLLAAGTLLGWIAAVCGLFDLAELWQTPGDPRRHAALTHALVNGSALAGFTVLATVECARYPAIHHCPAFLAIEAALLAAMLVGNHFGGAVVWSQPPPK